MKLEQIKEKLRSEEYGFLRKEKNLGSNVVLLALGGSHAYGMEKEGSDLDVRGIALNSKENILTGADFGQTVNTDTDTTVYSINRAIQLFAANNPNAMEILGCRPEHYLYLSDIGKEILNQKKLFMSRLCAHTFSEYAVSQLRKAENKASRSAGRTRCEEYILKRIHDAEHFFRSRFLPYDDSCVRLYIDRSAQEGYDSEIFMDVCMRHYPLRDWAGVWGEMKAIANCHNRPGTGSTEAPSRHKLGKHCVQALRLYMMGIDILEKEEIITYREQEHDILMSVRNGDFLDDSGQPGKAFYELLAEYEKRFDYARRNTSLQEVPDYRKINELKMHINEKVVLNNV